ncbi:hypothetical protein NDU88_004632 [Pleurodeles waltl]|uniref:Uncharacterized protein n=1 Tax=Pleurodeles waltl TaxID=8319 RepID=A0AAV7RIP1_PLEWA|nr:hypothetical protein NDU88_004632 [Pleurodeles waltl]
MFLSGLLPAAFYELIVSFTSFSLNVFHLYFSVAHPRGALLLGPPPLLNVASCSPLFPGVRSQGSVHTGLLRSLQPTPGPGAAQSRLPGRPDSPSPPHQDLNRRGRPIRSRRSSRDPGLTQDPGSTWQGRPQVHPGASGPIPGPRSFRITDGDRTASRVRSQPSGRLRLMCRPEVARFSV